MTSDDPEWCLHTLFQKYVFLEPTMKIWIKIDLHFLQQKCSPVTLVSDNKRFMRIFPTDDIVVSETAIFNAFPGYVFGNFRTKATIII